MRAGEGVRIGVLFVVGVPSLARRAGDGERFELTLLPEAAVAEEGGVFFIAVSSLPRVRVAKRVGDGVFLLSFASLNETCRNAAIVSAKDGFALPELLAFA